MDKLVNSVELNGIISVPSSKSDSQRAILCSALTSGVSILTNVGKSQDELAMLRTVEQLGAKVIKRDAISFEITGIKTFPKKAKIFAGESGLGVRLITCVLAAFDGDFEVNGSGSLLKRPQLFFDETLPCFGVEFTSNHGYLPFQIKGPLLGREAEVDGNASSQFLSGLLMALPLAESDSTLIVQKLKSKPYIDMTLKTLSEFGVSIDEKGYKVFKIAGKQCYHPTNYLIESDWSSASYWLAAGAIGHTIRLAGLSMTSLQADKAMIEVLEKAGCEIHITKKEINVKSSQLKSFLFDATDCPDLFPALVVVAAFCKGTSIIKGVHRLATKESDRGKALSEEFGKMGLRITIKGDEMHIPGGEKLNSATVHSHNDHRIAMSLAIVGTKVEGGITIQSAESVSKSYPDFWEDLAQLSMKK